MVVPTYGTYLVSTLESPEATQVGPYPEDTSCGTPGARLELKLSGQIRAAVDGGYRSKPLSCLYPVWKSWCSLRVGLPGYILPVDLEEDHSSSGGCGGIYLPVLFYA